MKKYLFTAILVASILVLFNQFDNNVSTEVTEVSAAQSDYYLKIPDIVGESTNAGREGEIEILSWSWGETTQIGLLLPAVQKVREAAAKSENDLGMIQFQMNMSKASPKIMEAVANGKVFPEVEFVGYRSYSDGSSMPYLTINMKNVVISSYQTGGSTSDIPVDSFSLNFGAIKFEYRAQAEDGSLGDPVIGMWNFEKNTNSY